MFKLFHLFSSEFSKEPGTINFWHIFWIRKYSNILGADTRCLTKNASLVSQGYFELRILERFQNVVFYLPNFQFQNVTFFLENQILVSLFVQFCDHILLFPPPSVPTPSTGLVVQVSHPAVLGGFVIRQVSGVAQLGELTLGC